MYQASTAAVSAVVTTTATPPPAMPSAGTGPQPKMNSGESGTSRTMPRQTASDGTSMLPVPRMTLASAFMQPDQDVADEDDVRVRERRFERAALAAHGRVDRPAEGEEDRRGDDAEARG